MKNLLVPTDFSTESQYAFELALHLASRIGGNITLLHVMEAPESGNFSTFGGPVNNGGSMDDLFRLRLLQTNKQHLHKLIAEAGQSTPTVPVHDLMQTGSIGPVILDTIKARQIDLVVIGAQEHTWLEHFFNGSTTERLVRLAPCPVLAVKHPDATFDVRQIVFPADFSSPEADSAVPGLRQVQALFPEAVLYLLQVNPDDNRLLAVAEADIAAFAERHGLTHAQPTITNATRLSHGITSFAQQIGADLVVMPTHGRTGLSHYLQQSIAETVATHAFPPVLTFRLP